MSMYVFPNAIKPDQCNLIIDHLLKTYEFDPAHINGALWADGDDLNKNLDIKARKSEICFVPEEDAVTQKVWNLVHHANDYYFKYKIVEFEPLQFAKYENGGHYTWHTDHTDNRDKPNRKLSISVNLSDNSTFEGGMLEFFHGDDKQEEKDKEGILNRQGTAIVFDSKDWHRVTPVTSGIRYSLVCWVIGPHFV